MRSFGLSANAIINPQGDLRKLVHGLLEQAQLQDSSLQSATCCTDTFIVDITLWHLQAESSTSCRCWPTQIRSKARQLIPGGRVLDVYSANTSMIDVLLRILRIHGQALPVCTDTNVRHIPAD